MGEWVWKAITDPTTEAEISKKQNVRCICEIFRNCEHWKYCIPRLIVALGEPTFVRSIAVAK
jgi:hypothetical protein